MYFARLTQEFRVCNAVHHDVPPTPGTLRSEHRCLVGKPSRPGCVAHREQVVLNADRVLMMLRHRCRCRLLGNGRAGSDGEQSDGEQSDEQKLSRRVTMRWHQTESNDPIVQERWRFL